MTPFNTVQNSDNFGLKYCYNKKKRFYKLLFKNDKF